MYFLLLTWLQTYSFEGLPLVLGSGCGGGRRGLWRQFWKFNVSYIMFGLTACLILTSFHQARVPHFPRNTYKHKALLPCFKVMLVVSIEGEKKRVSLRSPWSARSTHPQPLHTDIKVISSPSFVRGALQGGVWEHGGGSFLLVLVSFDTQVTHFLLWHVYSLIMSRAEGSTICCLPKPGWQAVTTPMKMHAHHPGAWGWHAVGGTDIPPLHTTKVEWTCLVALVSVRRVEGAA